MADGPDAPVFMVLCARLRFVAHGISAERCEYVTATDRELRLWKYLLKSFDCVKNEGAGGCSLDSFVRCVDDPAHRLAILPILIWLPIMTPP